ncbi:MAG: FtsX-like permease family protein [Verrucomicrobiota bacterium]
MKLLRELISGWTWKMAWRDSRRDRRRLVLFSLSIVFGIAALVSIGSLRDNLQAAIEVQAKELLGADLMLSSRRIYSEEVLAEMEKIPGQRVDETSFMTMLRFVDSDDGSRLVQIRSMEAGFPFYGNVITEPASAWQGFLSGDGVVLEQSLMDQFEAKVGDSVRIGDLETEILGYLVKAPPRPSAFSAFAPQAYLAPSQLDATQLLGSRSMARYRTYFQIDSNIDVEKEVLTKERKTFFSEAGMQHESVEKRKRNLGRALDNLYSFLSLIGFMALMLGGIGVASAIHVHVQGRVSTVATLRCIGCTTDQAFVIYLIQGLLLGVFGSVVGTGLGVAVQQLVPGMLSGMLPFEFDTPTSPRAIVMSVGIGLLLCVSFSLLPLIRVRRVSPLAALRSGVQTGAPTARDPLSWMVVGILFGALLLAGWSLSPQQRPWLGAAFVLALCLALGVLGLIAKGISVGAQRLRGQLSYTLRQGIANLHRPRNQTLPFLIAIGLGVFLIVTMISTERMLTSQFETEAAEGESNLFLIDVQPDQREGVEGVLGSLEMAVVETAPMIPMRLTHIKGKPIAEIQKDEKTKVPGWIVRRDFRSTYRAEIAESETLVEGEWIPRVENFDFFSSVAPISLDEGMAKDLNVGIGDKLEMDIQGLPLTLQIANLRQVDWERMGLGFFIVFPLGILEEAPGFHIMTSRAETSQLSGELQREMAIQFPNITVFDMSLILQTVESIVKRIGYIIQFMSLFTVGAGVVILIGTILSGKRDRIEESVLLRTLGASKSQISTILLTEYFTLGLFAALTGGVLALVATWALAIFVFEVDFLAHAWPLLLAIVFTAFLSSSFGMLLSRGVTNHPPLAVLRGEK